MDSAGRNLGRDEGPEGSVSLADALREHVEGLIDLGVESLPALPPERTAPPRRGMEERTQPERGTAPPPAPAGPHPGGQAAVAPPEGPLQTDLFAPPPRAPQGLDEVRTELGECRRCKLAGLGRSTVVFGAGNPAAEIVFVGEGPGQEEDIQGIPFVGRAGQLLTRIIEDGMGIKRAEVYICNIVKCRPPENREPERDEVRACSPFLEKQIRAIRPKVVVALGKPATSTLLGRTVAITQMRGKWQSYLGIPLMPTYHPAFVLRNYTPAVRGQVWEDMKEVLRFLGRRPPRRDA